MMEDRSDAIANVIKHKRWHPDEVVAVYKENQELRCFLTQLLSITAASYIGNARAYTALSRMNTMLLDKLRK